MTFTSPTNAFSPATATGINCSTGSQGYVYFILPDGVNQYALQQLGTPNAGPGFFGISSGTPDAGFLYANPGGTFQWGGVGNGSPFGPAGTIATTVLAPSTLDAGLGDLQVVGSWSCH